MGPYSGPIPAEAMGPYSGPVPAEIMGLYNPSTTRNHGPTQLASSHDVVTIPMAACPKRTQFCNVWYLQNVYGIL